MVESDSNFCSLVVGKEVVQVLLTARHLPVATISVGRVNLLFFRHLNLNLFHLKSDVLLRRIGFSRIFFLFFICISCFVCILIVILFSIFLIFVGFVFILIVTIILFRRGRLLRAGKNFESLHNAIHIHIKLPVVFVCIARSPAQLSIVSLVRLG